MIGPMALHDQIDTGLGIQIRLLDELTTQLGEEEDFDGDSPHIALLEHLAQTRLVELAEQQGESKGIRKDVLLRHAMRYVLTGARLGMFIVRRIASIAISVIRTILFQIGRILIRYLIPPLLSALGSFLASPVGWAVIAIAGIAGGGYLLYKYLVKDESEPKPDPQKLAPIVEIDVDDELHIKRLRRSLEEYSASQLLAPYPFAGSPHYESEEREAPRTYVEPLHGGEEAPPVSKGAMQGEAQRAVRSKSTGGLSEAALIQAMDSTGMTNPVERAMFLAQMAHESGSFKYSHEIWGPTAAQRRYEGRKDLGNVRPGDGKRYMGRGYIQLTGRSNYRQVGEYLGIDLEGNPELAARADIAALVALWYWRVARKNIPAAARKGDIRTVTRLINGGYNGLADRQQRFRKYLAREEQAIQLARTSAPKSESMDVAVVDTTPAPQQDLAPSSSQRAVPNNSTYASFRGVIVKAPA